MEVIIKKIGKLLPLNQSFTAFEGTTLYSVQLILSVDCTSTRLISFSSNDSFELLSPDKQLRVLLNNELNKDDLCLFLSEYQLIKDNKDEQQ